jgi:hypothetical protein
MVGSRQPSEVYACANSRWLRSATSHHGTPSAAATPRILSSMSVMLRQKTTACPLAVSQRLRTSKTNAERT